MIINADVKQLEVCMAAHESKDKLLCSLLKAGVDIHRFVGSFVYEQPEDEISDEDRTAVKTSVFGILYGNGPKTLAIRTGKSLEWCKAFIAQFYDLFPGIKEWHDKTTKIVEATGRLKLWDGVTLKFKKYPSKFEWQKSKGILESYNPPDIKNHPIQHLAFVLVSIILGDLFIKKAIYNRHKYLIINTVHDSIMIDCKDKYKDECIKDINEIVDKLPSRVLELFKEELLVPIKIDVTCGASWYEV